jgi:hypothetical protein
MSRPRRDYEVGYGRPPAHSRWRKGQSGNPRGSRKATRLYTIDIIRKKLMKKIGASEGKVRRKSTVLEMILLQMWVKEVGGDSRAGSVLLRYRELVSANTEPSEIIIESEYQIQPSSKGENTGDG